MMHAISRFFFGCFRASHSDPRSEFPAARSSRQYQAIWEEWSRHAVPGHGEQRELAVSRLRDCLQRNDFNLNLDFLGLTSLPELPPHIQSLTLDHNSLTQLPPLPPQLQCLTATGNQLTTLPALPSTLVTLDISSNQFSELPSSLLQFTPSGFLDITLNPLPPEALQTLMQHLNAGNDNATGAGLAGTAMVIPPPPPLLSETIGEWFSADQRAAVAAQWRAYQEEPNAVAFAAFLQRLSLTVSANRSPDFHSRVAAWLTRLGTNPTLRELTFAIAQGATTRCEDRVALHWNDMQKAALVNAIEQGEYDNKLPELVSAGREMFRLEQLEQIASNKVKSLALKDEIEVYLAYQVMLRDALKLSGGADKMRFFDASWVTESDLRDAARKVRISENHGFPGWLAQWEPWQTMLSRNEPVHYQHAQARRYSEVEKNYQARVSAALNALQMTSDPDAEVVVGKKVMDSINHEIFMPLTREVLARKGLTSLLNRPWLPEARLPRSTATSE